MSVSKEAINEVMRLAKKFEDSGYNKDSLSSNQWAFVLEVGKQLIEDSESTCSSNLPETYAEIDYGDRLDMNDPEAIDGARFDDLNRQRYMER